MLKVNTVKAGREYRAKVHGQSLSFHYDGSGDYVQIFTPTSALGLFLVSRFGGSLSPNGIREFVAATWPS